MATDATPNPQPIPLWRYVQCAVVGMALAAILVMGLAVGYLKLREDELVFRTAESHLSAQAAPPVPDTQRTLITTADGSNLVGIVLRAAPEKNNGLWILHLHGNADSTFSAPQRKHIELLRSLGFSVLSFDYRGFGLSPGTASEAHMYEDADAAYHYLLRYGIEAKHIVLWGHSLGSGPATYLATQNEAAALVLFGAFTSVPEAAQDIYPWLPVKWVARIHFDSRARLPNVHIPVLIAHSLTDTTIAYYHAQELYSVANEPKQLLALHSAPDGYGGHLQGLYDRPDLIVENLSKLMAVDLGVR